MGYVLGKLENDPVAMFNPFAENTKCVLVANWCVSVIARSDARFV